MTKAQKIIKELEAELDEFTNESEKMDMSRVQHPVKWFARMSFYQAQAFKKVFERLDEIEAQVKERDNRRISTKINRENRELKANPPIYRKKY